MLTRLLTKKVPYTFNRAWYYYFSRRVPADLLSHYSYGCINILFNIQNLELSKKKLAEKSLNFEQKILKEVVGSQDQIAASYGGFNSIKFLKNGTHIIEDLKINKKIERKLNNRLILLFTGNQRRANDIAKTYVNQLTSKKKKTNDRNSGFCR